MRGRYLYLLMAAAAFPVQAADRAQGDWVTGTGDAHVRVAACPGAEQTLCGTIVWLAEPLNAEGKPKRDKNNPDPALQNRPIAGTQIISGMKPGAAGKWEDGEIYDPSVGKKYSSTMKLGPHGELLVEGCFLLFCRQQTWHRVGG